MRAKRKKRPTWGRDEVKIIKELRKLITSRINIEDIFTGDWSDFDFDIYRPKTDNPIRTNLHPIKQSPIEGASQAYGEYDSQIRPLIRGKFYLTHGLHWPFWNSMHDYKYTGALDIIYILTKEEMKNYRGRNPLATPREEPEEEIIAMKWPAYWFGYTFDKPSLQICPHVHVVTGWNLLSAMNESEFTKKFKQLIPIGDSKIIALNYPNL